MRAKCAACPTHVCYTKGVNCTGVPADEVRRAYTEEELQMMDAAAYVEGTFYSNITRLQEIAEFAKKMGYRKLGLAFCIGLNEEARYIARYYEKQGFEVYSVCCKNCSLPRKSSACVRSSPNWTTRPCAIRNSRRASWRNRAWNCPSCAAFALGTIRSLLPTAMSL